MSRGMKALALLLAASLVVGCDGPSAPTRAAASPTAPAPRSAPGYSTVVLQGVPHVRQKPDFCGEACVEMAARRLGKPIDQDAVFALSGLDPGLGRGVA